MEKISWKDRVRNEEVLHRMKEGRNILQTIKRRKVSWFDRILCRNCDIKRLIERKIEGRILVAGRRRGRRKQPLNDLDETGSSVN